MKLPTSLDASSLARFVGKAFPKVTTGHAFNPNLTRISYSMSVYKKDGQYAMLRVGDPTLSPPKSRVDSLMLNLGRCLSQDGIMVSGSILRAEPSYSPALSSEFAQALIEWRNSVQATVAAENPPATSTKLPSTSTAPKVLLVWTRGGRSLQELTHLTSHRIFHSDLLRPEEHDMRVVVLCPVTLRGGLTRAFKYKSAGPHVSVLGVTVSSLASTISQLRRIVGEDYRANYPALSLELGVKSLLPLLPKDTFVSLDSASSPSSIFVSEYTGPLEQPESVLMREREATEAMSRINSAYQLQSEFTDYSEPEWTFKHYSL